MVPVQARHAPRLEPLLERATALLEPARTDGPAIDPPPAPGWSAPEPPRRPVGESLGDKAFGGRPRRRASEKLGARWASPSQVNAKDPAPIDEEAYRPQN